MVPQGDLMDHANRIALTRSWTRYLASKWRGVSAQVPDGPVPTSELETARLAELLAQAGDGQDATPLAVAQTLFENTVALAGLRSAGDVLDGCGVTWCAIKGAALVTCEPQLLRARRMSDVDVLVAPWALDAAADALRNAGAVVAPTSPDAQNTRSAAMRHAGGVVHIDLHGGLAVGRQFGALGTALLHSRRTVRGIRVPSPELLLLATVWHRARASWSGDLREVFDVWLLAGTARSAGDNNEENTSVDTEGLRVDAGALVAAAFEHGLASHLLLSLREAEIWFGPNAGVDRLVAMLEARLTRAERRRVGALSALLKRGGALPWAAVPIAGRYATLAWLSPAPAKVLVDGGEYATRRLMVAVQRGGAAGGRLGRLLRRRG